MNYASRKICLWLFLGALTGCTEVRSPAPAEPKWIGHWNGQTFYNKADMLAAEEAFERQEKIRAEEAEAAKKKEAEKREEYAATRPAKIAEAIRRRQVLIGMSMDDVRVSWGKPTTVVSETTTVDGTVSVWKYVDGSYYLTFANGILAMYSRRP